VSGELRGRLQGALGAAYTLERELGGGGMSRVFVATENALGRRVVVKVLPPETAAGVNLERFRREIQLAASLQHPHIVPLHAAGSGGDLLYFTMPFIEGESLRARVVRDGELPVNAAVRILRDVADALAYAHRRGVVHRDIKPDNVLLSGQHALVTDFGVARALESSTGESSLTSLGVALGTPAYMAPEQAAAEPQVDHRADIYAFGCLAYEVLTGRPPFAGMSAQQVLAAHVTQHPEPITSRRQACPPALAALITRCLEKKPADRPQSASELHEQLELNATPSGGSMPTTAVALPAVRPSRRRWLLAAGVAGLAGITIALGAGYVAAGRRDSRDRHRVIAPMFVNPTGDAAFDPVAASAMARISSGLSEIEGVEVEDGAENRSGAGTVVRGAVYRQGDSIQVSATITEAITSRTLYTIGPFASPATAPAPAVEQVAQRVVGGVAMLLDPSWGAQGVVPGRAPRWDAYREFHLGDVAFYREETDSAYQLFARAVALDSTFGFARLRAANALVNGGPRHVARADSAIAAADLHRGAYSPFELQFLGWLRAWSRGDWEGSRAATMEMARLAPRSAFAAYTWGALANVTRRRREAVRILGALDPQSEALRFRPFYYNHLTRALHALGDYRRELAAAEQARAQFPELLYMRLPKVRALAALGRIEELDAYLEDCLAQPSDSRLGTTPGSILDSAVIELRAHGQAQAADSVLQRLLGWLSGRPSAEAATEEVRRVRVDALSLAGRWDEAQAAADSLSAAQPGPVYVGKRGVIAARRGDRAMAERLGAELAGMPSWRGQSSFWRGKIAAALNQRPQAIALLRDAVAQGNLSLSNSDADPDLEALRDLPEFRALTAPRD
jgi:serine/threonine-protein kinase